MLDVVIVTIYFSSLYEIKLLKKVGCFDVTIILFNTATRYRYEV